MGSVAEADGQYVYANITELCIFAPLAEPPNPTGLQNTKGNYWVNYTWSAGTGANVTNSYNVSMNGTWTNGSSNTYMNVSVGPSGWANITVWVYNSTGNGNLSDGSVSANVQAPAAPTLRRGCYAGSDGGERADTDLDGYTDFNELRIGRTRMTHAIQIRKAQLV